MRLTLPSAAVLAIPFLLAASCVDDTPGEFGPSEPSGPTVPTTQRDDVNFASAWVYLYGDAASGVSHGDVHRLSDGSFATLRMPGGSRMEVVRFSPEGIPLGNRSFTVPGTYAGCPFMPNEETFVDDSAILSYGGLVFRVDLASGEVMWEAEFDGQLQHSTAGFWVVEGLYDQAPARIRPLDIERGALLPGLSVADLGPADGRQFFGARVVYHADESTDRTYRRGLATDETRQYLVAHVATVDGGPAARLTIDSYAEGDEAPAWTYTHDFTRATYGRPNYAVVGGHLLFAAASELLAVDLATGTERWAYAVRPEGASVDRAYAFSDVPLQVSADGAEVRFWDVGKGFHRVAVATGERVGAGALVRTVPVAAEPIGDDYVLTTCPDGEIVLSDARTGERVRSFRGITSAYHAPVGTHYDADADRLVLAGGRGVYALDDPAGNILP